MKEGNIQYVIVCICLLYTGLSGCKVSRNSTGSFKEGNANGVVRVKESLIKSKSDFRTAWVKKYSCEIRENWKRKEFYGDIKIIKGERITITVKSGIGIETARALLTKDSVIIVDRINKEVYCGGYEQMKEYFGLLDCYKKVEDLIVGNNSMVLEEMEQENQNKYNVKRGENSRELIVYEAGIEKKRNKKFTIGMDKYNIIEYMEENGKNEMLKVTYLNWYDIEQMKFPKEVKTETYKSGEKNTAIIKYEKVEINGKISIKFKIPDGYIVTKL